MVSISLYYIRYLSTIILIHYNLDKFVLFKSEKSLENLEKQFKKQFETLFIAQLKLKPLKLN